MMNKYILISIVFISSNISANFNDNLRLISFSNVFSNIEGSMYPQKNTLIVEKDSKAANDMDMAIKTSKEVRKSRIGGLKNLYYHIQRQRIGHEYASLTFDVGGSIIPMQSKPKAYMKEVESLHIDLSIDNMSIGHELLFGKKYIEEMAEMYAQSGSEIISTNISDSEGYLFNPYTEHIIKGHKVAVIGISNVTINESNDIYNEYDVDKISSMVEMFRAEGNELVIALSSNSIDFNVNLAKSVVGIDVVIGGSDSLILDYPIRVKNEDGYTMVLTTGEKGNFLSIMDIDMSKDNFGRFVYRILPTSEAGIARIKSQVDIFIDEENIKEMRLVDAIEDMEVGVSVMDSMDLVVLDIIKKVTGSKVILGVPPMGGMLIEKGDEIVEGDIERYFSGINNKLTLTTLPGYKIESVLEEYYKNSLANNGYRALRSMGIDYSIDVSKTNDKITITKIDGQVLDLDKKYDVAIWGGIYPEDKSGESLIEIIKNGIVGVKKIPKLKDKVIILK